MNRQSRRNHKRIDINRIHPIWIRVVSGLAAVIVFCTVYNLILPASALTTNRAMDTPGIEEGFAVSDEHEGMEDTEEHEDPNNAESVPPADDSALDANPGEQNPGGSTGVNSDNSSGNDFRTISDVTGESEETGEVKETTDEASEDITESKNNTGSEGKEASESGNNADSGEQKDSEPANQDGTELIDTDPQEKLPAEADEKPEEEISEEENEEEKEEREEEPVFVDRIETEDRETGIRASLAFEDKILRDTDVLKISVASDENCDQDVVIPLEDLREGITERCAEIANSDIDEDEKLSADDIEIVKAEFIGLAIEDKDGATVSLPENSKMQVEIVFPGSYEAVEKEYQCVLMAEQSAEDFAEASPVASMKKLNANISNSDENNTIVSFGTEQLNSAGIVVFRAAAKQMLRKNTRMLGAKAADEQVVIVVNKQWRDEDGDETEEKLPDTATFKLSRNVKVGTPIGESDEKTLLIKTSNNRKGIGGFYSFERGSRAVISYSYNDNYANNGNPWYAVNGGEGKSLKKHPTGEVSVDIPESGMAVVEFSEDWSGSELQGIGVLGRPLYKYEYQTGPDTSYVSPEITLSRGEDGVWSGAFEPQVRKEESVEDDLPIKMEYTYFVSEDPITGWAAAYSENNTEGLTESGTVDVINTRTSTDVTVKKIWVDSTGDSSWPAEVSVTVSLKRSDDEPINLIDGTVLTKNELQKQLTAETESGRWENLELLPEGVTYEVEETSVAGAELGGHVITIGAKQYVSSVERVGNHFTISNSEMGESTSVSASKAWGDNTEIAHAVQFTLYHQVPEGTEGAEQIGDSWYKIVVADNAGDSIENPVAVAAIQNSEGEYSWPSDTKAEWNNIPKQEGGKDISYLVKETGVYFGNLTSDDPATEDVNESGRVPSGATWSSTAGYVVTPSDSIAVSAGEEARFTNGGTGQDVVLEKRWDGNLTENMAWEATFVLEELEYPYADKNGYITYDPETAHDDPEHDGTWQEVVPRKEWTISSSSNLTERTLKGLPKFRTKEDGKVYILLYSVTEIGYKVWASPDKTQNPVYSWTKNGGYSGDVHFTPEYLEDADEVTNYTIEVLNSERNEKENIFINFDLKKKWTPETDHVEDREDSYAIFQLKRKSHQEFKKMNDPEVDYERFVTVRLVDAAGRELTSLQVEKNAQIKFQAGFKAGQDGIGTADFVSTDGTAGHVMISNSTALPSQAMVSSQPFRVNADATYQYNSGAEYLADGIYGVVISDRCDGTPTADVDDATFNNNDYRYRVDKATGHVVTYESGTVNDTQNTNGWTLEFKGFPQTLIDTGIAQETTTVYGYYFEEVASNPDWKSAYYQADSSWNKTNVINGDANNRIYFDDRVIAENKKSHLTIKKYWESMVQSEMPNVVVDIMRVESDGNNSIGSEEIYKTVILTAENNFEYELYDLPVNAPNNRYYAYLPRERGITAKKPGDAGVSADGMITNISQVPYVQLNSTYFGNATFAAAKEGSTINYMRLKQDLSPEDVKTDFWQLRDKAEIVRSGSGTICLINNPKKTGYQLHVRKRWHKFTTAGGMTTESNYDGAYFTAMLVQIVRVYDEAKGEWVEVDRYDYGSKFEWHYDGNTNFTYKDPGRESNITIRYHNGEWLVDIPEGQGNDGSNLPLYGYYKMPDGTITIAEYDYTIREISVTSKDGYHWAISDHIQPQSEQSAHNWMLDNYPDADMKIIKHWPTKETNQDATAVYFKITDSNRKNVIKEIVEKMSYAEHQLTPGDVAEYNGEWCLVIRGATNSTDDWVGYVDHLPLFDFSKTVFGNGEIPPGGMPGELTYSVEEVAAVNSQGQVVPSSGLYIPFYQVTTRGTKGSIRSSANGIQLGMYDTVGGKEVLQPTIVEVTNNAEVDLEAEKRFYGEDASGNKTQVDPRTMSDWNEEDGGPVTAVKYIVRVDTFEGDAEIPTSELSGYLTSGWKTGGALAEDESGAEVFTISIGENSKTDAVGIYWSDKPEALQGLPSVKIVTDGTNVKVYRYKYSIIEKAVYAGETDVTAKFVKEQTYDSNKEVWKIDNTRSKTEYTSFEFTKKWEGADSATAQNWPEGKEIEIEIIRTKNESADSSFSLKYKITKGNCTSTEGIAADRSSTYPDGTDTPLLKYLNATKYAYKLDNLLWKAGEDEYVYYVKENSTVDGYDEAVYYQMIDGQLVKIKKGAANGGKTNDEGMIVNKESWGVALPSTGGPGTRLFTILGSILLVIAGVLLIRRRSLV